MEEDFLFIYRNEDSVICGKHQNAVAEICARYLLEEGIPLIRRFSGGGTVFHDPGNINFSFITTAEDSKVIDFRKYAQPVVAFLNDKGIPAKLNDRHDIILHDKKISGHAAHSKGRRALHHGTLLYNANLDRLRKSLISNKDKFISRAVESVRSSVCNICDEMSGMPEVEKFMEELSGYLSGTFGIEETVDSGNIDPGKTERLIKEKYDDWNWNFGYGPRYSFEVYSALNGELIHLHAVVEDGRFKNLTLQESTTFDAALHKLVGIRHDWLEVFKTLSGHLEEELAIEVTELLF